MQRVRVCVLERRDVLVEHCPGTRRRGLGDVVGRQRQLAQPAAGALQGALHRGHRQAEDPRHLGGGECQHVSQDQHRPLRARQVLQGSRSARAAALPAPQRRPPDPRRPGRPARPGSAAATGRRARPTRARPAGPARGRRGRRAAPGGLTARARSGTRWSRSGRARCGPTTVPRTRRKNATRAGTSPAPRPPRRHRAEHAVAVRQHLPPQRLGVPDERVVAVRPHTAHRGGRPAGRRAGGSA